MGKIVAIGGGEIASGETKRINQYIVSLAEKKNPKLLFIPTASLDDDEYIAKVKKAFGELNCDIVNLCLTKEKYTDEEIKALILGSDIIYVGGGNSITMLEIWGKYKVDQYLKEAYEKGIILSGLSAGSLCWFNFAYIDKNFFNENKGKYIEKLFALDFIHAAFSPHYNEEGRDKFDEMIEKDDITGIALDNRAAFVEIDGEYKIFKEIGEARAFKIYKEDGKQIKIELKADESFKL